MTADKSPQRNNASQIRKQESIVRSLEEQSLKLLEIAKTLQKFCNLTSSLEQLVFSLDGSNTLVDRAIELVGSFDETYENLSTERLEIRIEGIENKIQDDMRFFIDLIKTQTSPRGQKKTQILPENHVDEFKRRIQKAFAFRVLLCERGETLPPFAPEIPHADILAAINNLKIRVQVHRKQLSEELNTFKEKVEAYLSGSDLSGDVRELIANLLQSIVGNIEHIEQGGDLNDIPVRIECVVSEIRSLGSKKVSASNKENKETTSKTASTPQKAKPSEKNQENDYFDRVKKWLDSPLGVSWKQINKEHKDK